MSLPKILQEQSGFAPLIKIDPNTQEVKHSEPGHSEDRTGQAAIPAVLAGLYKHSISDEGAEDILRGKYSTDWVKKVFGEYYDTAIERVAAYASISPEKAGIIMNDIAVKAAEYIKGLKETNNNIAGVKEYLVSQRQEILSYLPAALQIGEILDDDTMDDRTNKMEGPVSSLIQKLAGNFDASDLDEKKTQIK